MTNNLRKQRELKKSLPKFLSKLEAIISSDVEENRLLTVDESNRLIDSSNLGLPKTKTGFTIDFSRKNNRNFREFINALYQANSSPVYVWIEDSNIHGLYKAPSIRSINFSFPFDIDDNGIIVFRTDDCKDKLLIDFYEENGCEMLDVEIQGCNWSQLICDDFEL